MPAKKSAKKQSDRYSDVLNRNNLHTLFRYEKPSPEHEAQYTAIRAGLYTLANVILTNTPICPGQQTALRKMTDVWNALDTSDMWNRIEK
jgi:hypothetical protein